MARISGIDLPEQKRVDIALTYIYGIGRSNVKVVLSKSKIDGTKRVKELTDNYKNFRQNFQQVRICQNKLNDLLNQFEKITKEKTKMLKDFI